MSLIHSAPYLRRFVRGEEARPGGKGITLSLRGRWGVGKTYYWNHIIADERGDQLPAGARRRYAYVSLFGLNNMEAVKAALCSEMLVERAPRKLSWLGRDREATLSISKSGAKLIETLVGTKGAASALVGALAYASVRDALVCFDDLERRGEGLSIKDLFGLVTQLREERDCDVAVIVNEGHLSEDEIAQLNLHGEKAIDAHVRFDPTPTEALEASLPDGVPWRDLIAECCLRLNITNIRVIQRIIRKIEQIEQEIEDCSATTQESIVRSLVFLVWTYYGADGGAPPFAVARRPYDPIAFSMMGQGLSEDEKKLQLVVSDYGHHISRGLDQVLADMVEQGYPDSTVLAAVLTERERRAESQQSLTSLSEAWDLYAETFDDNADEFVEALVKAFQSNVDDVEPHQLTSATSVLRSLGHNERAEALIDLYCERHADEIRQGEHNDFRFRTDDDYLKRKLMEVRLGDADLPELTGVFERLGTRNNWDRNDLKALAGATEHEIRDTIEQIEGDWVVAGVRRALSFGGNEFTEPGGVSIAGKTRVALSDLASKHLMNQVRIKNLYDIDPAPLSNEPLPPQIDTPTRNGD